MSPEKDHIRSSLEDEISVTDSAASDPDGSGSGGDVAAGAAASLVMLHTLAEGGESPRVRVNKTTLKANYFKSLHLATFGFYEQPGKLIRMLVLLIGVSAGLQFILVTDLSGLILTFDAVWHFRELFSPRMNPGFHCTGQMADTVYAVVWMSGLLMSTLWIEWPMVAGGLWNGQAYVMDNEHREALSLTTTTPSEVDCSTLEINTRNQVGDEQKMSPEKDHIRSSLEDEISVTDSAASDPDGSGSGGDVAAGAAASLVMLVFRRCPSRKPLTCLKGIGKGVSLYTTTTPVRPSIPQKQVVLQQLHIQWHGPLWHATNGLALHQNPQRGRDPAYKDPRIRHNSRFYSFSDSFHVPELFTDVAVESRLSAELLLSQTMTIFPWSLTPSHLYPANPSISFEKLTIFHRCLVPTPRADAISTTLAAPRKKKRRSQWQHEGRSTSKRTPGLHMLHFLWPNRHHRSCLLETSALTPTWRALSPLADHTTTACPSLPLRKSGRALSTPSPPRSLWPVIL
ncbi:hypothetical protein F2P79_007735 [Pimephales promelas]|nr:hypothetical protein F2P79_007735 [Pimephales promelas]